MPTLKLALAAGEAKRLEIHKPFFGSARTLRLDGVDVGRIDDVGALREGRSFPLPDGTTLHVRLEKQSGFMRGDRLRVERDGVLLRDSPAHPVYDVRQATNALWFIGGLNVLAGLAVMGLVDFPTGAGVLVEALVYLAFAWQARREKRWALIAGLALYVLDTLVSLADGRLGNLGGIYLRVAIATFLVRGILAHSELAKVDAHEVANVFR
jgi:hypothetical protein